MIGLSLLPFGAALIVRYFGIASRAAFTVVGLFLLNGALATVEIRHQCREACVGPAPRDAPDLIVQTPPFLDDDHRAHGCSGLGQIAVDGAAVGTLEADGLRHGWLLG